MGVSRREYARLRGVSESAVRKAIAAGRITLEPDGTIDPERADQEWADCTEPTLRRGERAQRLATEAPAGTVRAKSATDAPPLGTKAVPQSAVDAVRDTLRQEGIDPEIGEEPGGEVSFMRARLANEILKAQLQKVKLRKAKAELVDRSKAMQLVFDLARRERDAWIGWPARIAANMAAELGVDPRRLEVALERYLRQHLSELAEVRVEFR
jgi:hypothetical protein